MTVRRRVRWIAAGAGLAYAVLLRPRLQTWGVTRAESAGVLPGDDVVRARWQTTRAVTIATHPRMCGRGWCRWASAAPAGTATTGWSEPQE
jgi:hypothetical protein